MQDFAPVAEREAALALIKRDQDATSDAAAAGVEEARDEQGEATAEEEDDFGIAAEGEDDDCEHADDDHADRFNGDAPTDDRCVYACMWLL